MTSLSELYYEHTYWDMYRDEMSQKLASHKELNSMEELDYKLAEKYNELLALAKQIDLDRFHWMDSY